MAIPAPPNLAVPRPLPDLTLRRWRERDLPALLAAHADPTMKRFLMHHIEDETAAESWFAEQQENWDARTRFAFAIVDGVGDVEQAQDVDPVGLMSVRRPQPDGEVTEVGYWVAAPARGRGVAPRALECAVAWISESTGGTPHPVTRVELLHNLDNEASCRVAEKCGFVLEKVLPPYPPKWPEPGHLHVRRM